MAKRKIIKIDEDKCNGCGDCVVDCAEGALQIVNGKAKLVKDIFCDGLGACIGSCPTGALVIEEREAKDFDEKAVAEHLATMKKKKDNNSSSLKVVNKAHSGGCPGSAIRADLNKDAKAPSNSGGPAQAIPSELNQWPVQLHLVRPDAPFFKDKELVVLSTCAPIASADVHWRFMRGRSLVVACPKLDRTEPYIEKLSAILSEESIPKVIVLRLEVPCCGGLTEMVKSAIANTKRADLEMEEVFVGINGDITENKGTEDAHF